MRTKLSNAIAIIGVVVCVLSLFVSYLVIPGPLNDKKIVLVPRNTSLKEIAYILHDAKVIKAPMVFYGAAKLFNHFNRLKAGEYVFSPHTSPIQVINVLRLGRSVIHQITIPEGTTVYYAMELLRNQPILLGDIIGEIPEGSLMPDTYFFSYGDTRQGMINRMQEKMSAKLEALWLKRDQSIPLKNQHEAIILASIIEKETSLSKEKPRVSAVFLNRIKKDMKLQADPTIIYAISNKTGKLGRPLTKQDLKYDSPYNTYLYKGLPPTPIANPGIEAIKAALNPIKTSDLFFVVDGTGGHAFSDNLAEHNDNVRSYREKVREGSNM